MEKKLTSHQQKIHQKRYQRKQLEKLDGELKYLYTCLKRMIIGDYHQRAFQVLRECKLG